MPSFEKAEKLKSIEIDFNNFLLLNLINIKGIIDLKINEFTNSDLKILINLNSIKRLKLFDGKMENLQGIEYLKNLDTLHIANARKLTNTTAIIQNESLVNFMLEGQSKITDWNFLSEKNNFKEISIEKSNSVDFFKKMNNLDFFFCRKVIDKKIKVFYFLNIIMKI